MRLFSALETAFPVRFESRRLGEHSDLDGLISIGDEGGRSADSPRCLVLAQGTGGSPAPGVVQLSASPLLDNRLRGQALRDDHARGLVGCADVVQAKHVFASCGRSALWVRTADKAGIERAALAPDELQADESLRDLFVPGRWLGVLPLVHFLRDVCAELSWTPPAPRATFVVDDPNLHWPTYGHLRFAELASHAQKHGYHVAFATIPLDAWFVHPKAGRLFREGPHVLSLLAHGNDHVHAEFVRQRPEHEAIRLLAQAHRRLAGLERRSGVEVSRLMVAPFGLCSPEMMRTLLRTGFEGLVHSWPTSRIGRPLAGWEIADLVEGGLPVFPRLHLDNQRDDIVLRSYLGQPVIIYGHHGDFADGLDVLAELSTYVERVARVSWMSPGQIARASFLTRREGTTLRIRPYSRHVELDVPAGVESVTVELSGSHGEAERQTIHYEAGSVVGSARFENSASVAFDTHGTPRLLIRLRRDDAVDPASIQLPRARLWPILRRMATEGRDRLAPHLHRTHRASL